ncbi:hypothetical protein HanRHA438_Chr10g0444141 [Helianthus annuus]|nr:hypothetical protein HanRHA438_Chr10g0444141 [Helianthus annuus]
MGEQSNITFLVTFSSRTKEDTLKVLCFLSLLMKLMFLDILVNIIWQQTDLQILGPCIIN